HLPDQWRRFLILLRQGLSTPTHTHTHHHLALRGIGQYQRGGNQTDWRSSRMIKRAIQASASVLVLAAAIYSGAAAAHGRVAMEEDTCMRRLGDNSMVHLSAYQPQHEPSDQYCTDIPKEGNTFLVVDLVDPALRDIPIAMKVVRGTNEQDGETVAYVRPSYHPD